MKNKLIFCVLFSLITNLSFSQKLTYLDLKYLFENNVDDGNDYILKKGFEFLKTETEDNSEDKSMTWAYQRNSYDDKAIAFIAKFKFDANSGFVWCQFSDVNIMNQIKTYCKSIGFKIKNSEIDKFDSFCSTYENSKFIITFCSGINKDSNRNSYTITFDNK
ncbi:MAG: hypothetical protein GZ087_11930 [Flavobacterium sp.]|nr:hypothetical protein [Flavobacterium sp.]